MPIDLEIQRATESPGIPTDADFEEWVGAALAGQPGRLSLAIRLVDEAEAQAMNRDYRQKDKATNVLSFPAELFEGLPDEVRAAQLGDILICAPLVAREAAELDRAGKFHWAHLTVHGVLHLLGYDHEQAGDALEMEAMETMVLEKLGFPAPYEES